MLAGCHPDQPNCARSGKWQKKIEDEYGEHPRFITCNGLLDEARSIEPRLRSHTNANVIANYLKEWGCDNSKRVSGVVSTT